MGRLTRLLLPRVSVLSGLVVLMLVVEGIALFRPPRWRSPAVAPTPDGLLVAWLEGTGGSAPVRVQAFDRALEPRGPARRYGRAPASAQLSFWTDGDPTRLVLVPDRLGVAEAPLGVFDSAARRADPPAARGSRWPAWSAAGDDRGWRPSSGGWLTDSGRTLSSTVLDVDGRLRAILEPRQGSWAVWPVDGSRGRSAVLLESVHCPPLATYGCVAAAAVDDDVVVAWMRSRALGSELVLSRIRPFGAVRSAVLGREQSAILVAALSALFALVLALVVHAGRKALVASRVLGSLRPGAGVWLDGRLDEPRPELVKDAGASPWRMRTAAAWLNVPSGDRVLLQTGTPYVVTLAALRGELPARAADVASFDRAYAAGTFTSPDEAGAYRGGAAGALRLELLADAPLPQVRSALRATIAFACADVVILCAVALVAAVMAL